MTVRIWLHEGHDGEPGVEAHALDLLGFSTWAGSEREVVAKLPIKLREYLAWRSAHGLRVDVPSVDVEIAGRLTGNEILFPPDREPARREDVDLTIRLLACSRADLIALLEAAPAGAIDWDPPYQRFAPWADWRTIRANLAHVANAETHYYTRNVGHEPSRPPAAPDEDWREFLPRSREETVGFLEALGSAADLSRIVTVDRGFGEEAWSVRKALRRLVNHELLHTKSIRRILREYRAREAGRVRR